MRSLNFRIAIIDRNNNIQISPDRKVLTFSGGDIPIGEVLFAAVPTSPSNQQVDSSISFTGTPVPEASGFLGTLFLGSIGAGSLLKHYWKTGKNRGNIARINVFESI